MVDLSELKVGDTVKFRDGSGSKVLNLSAHNHNKIYPYSISFEDRRAMYTRNGCYFSDGDINYIDIIESIPKEDSGIDVSSINKGDLVTTRDGNTYEVHSIDRNEKNDADDSWADYNITLAMYHGGLYTKAGHYQTDCEDPMDIVEVQKVKQKAEKKIIRNHVDLHNIAEGDVVYFEDGSEAVVDNVTFEQNYAVITFYDFGTFEFNYDGSKFQEDAEVGNIIHVLHGAPEPVKETYKSADDPVNHPSHYTRGGIECIEAIKASMTAEAYKGYLKGNVLKYLWRYENKGKPVEDLKKANTYLEWLIKENDERPNQLVIIQRTNYPQKSMQS